MSTTTAPNCGIMFALFTTIGTTLLLLGLLPIGMKFTYVQELSEPPVVAAIGIMWKLALTNFPICIYFPLRRKRKPAVRVGGVANGDADADIPKVGFRKFNESPSAPLVSIVPPGGELNTSTLCRFIGCLFFLHGSINCRNISRIGFESNSITAVQMAERQYTVCRFEEIGPNTVGDFRRVIKREYATWTDNFMRSVVLAGDWLYGNIGLEKQCQIRDEMGALVNLFMLRRSAPEPSEYFNPVDNFTYKDLAGINEGLHNYIHLYDEKAPNFPKSVARYYQKVQKTCVELAKKTFGQKVYTLFRPDTDNKPYWIGEQFCGTEAFQAMHWGFRFFGADTSRLTCFLFYAGREIENASDFPELCAAEREASDTLGAGVAGTPFLTRDTINIVKTYILGHDI